MSPAAEKNQGILKRPAIMQGKYQLTTKGFLWKVSTLSVRALGQSCRRFWRSTALITKEVYSSLTIGVLMGMGDLPVHSRGLASISLSRRSPWFHE